MIYNILFCYSYSLIGFYCTLICFSFHIDPNLDSWILNRMILLCIPSYDPSIGRNESIPPGTIPVFMESIKIQYNEYVILIN